MHRASKTALGIVFVILGAVPIAGASGAGGDRVPDKRERPVFGGTVPPPFGGTVGIRVTVPSTDPAIPAADLDLAMYTRGIGPAFFTSGGSLFGYVGYPFLGYPALDYGDGSTVSTTALPNTTVGGGPGGSTVYRSLASFSHSYPGPGSYTVRTSMVCVACYRSSFVVFPAGSPVPPTFTATYDVMPSTVIGNLPLRLTYARTTSTFFSSYSVRYLVTYYPLITNTAQVAFSPLDVPAASEWGLLALGVSLLAAGFVLMRRRV